VRRVAITGIGCLSAAGAGPEALAASLSGEGPGGKPIQVEGLRGRIRTLRVSRIPPFDRQAHLPSRKLRRMGEHSQLWVIGCQMARSDAGWDSAQELLPPPRLRGTFLGTGFGCIDTTWEYLTGMLKDGAATANPFLFAESVANAPAGHSAIALDTRGANMTLTAADASAATALALAERSIRHGRLDMAYCGGVEMLSEPLLRVLASLGCPEVVGEGCACILLETLDAARARGARIYAEVAGSFLASDPEASPTQWSWNPEAFSRTMQGAIDSVAGEPVPSGAHFRKVYLHAPGSPGADAAEASAADRVLPGVPRESVSRKSGAFAAAGGFSLVAAALDGRGALKGPAAADRPAMAMVNASSWGGSLVSVVLRDPGVA
jgi:3-oxoacyl-[acyl-carrier-protein] synthase II